MADKERMNRKFSDLRRYSAILAEITPKSYELYGKAGNLVRSAVERNLQLVSDTELDIAVLLYKVLAPKPVGDDESVIESLSGKLPSRVISRLKERRRLRNLLIHAYAQAGYDRETFEQASSTKDVEEFIKGAKALVEAH